MATVMTEPTGRGKPLNVEYNIIPFIDLLSCLIAFLLMTAVWTQISMIRSNEGTSASPSKADFTLALYVFKDYQDLSVGESRTVRIPKDKTGYNLPRLEQELLRVKQTHPAKEDILILAQDKVVYSDLVSTMDTCIGTNFPNITVSGMLE